MLVCPCDKFELTAFSVCCVLCVVGAHGVVALRSLLLQAVLSMYSRSFCRLCRVWTR